MGAGILHFAGEHERRDIFMGVGDGIQAPLLGLVTAGL